MSSELNIEQVSQQVIEFIYDLFREISESKKIPQDKMSIVVDNPSHTEMGKTSMMVLDWRTGRGERLLEPVIRKIPCVDKMIKQKTGGGVVGMIASMAESVSLHNPVSKIFGYFDTIHTNLATKHAVLRQFFVVQLLVNPASQKLQLAAYSKEPNKPLTQLRWIEEQEVMEILLKKPEENAK